MIKLKILTCGDHIIMGITHMGTQCNHKGPCKRRLRVRGDVRPEAEVRVMEAMPLEAGGLQKMDKRQRNGSFPGAS